MTTLRPCTQLEWHRVSNLVNNSRNKSDKCNKPLEMIKVEKPEMNKMMSVWLNVRKRREASLASGSDNEEEEQKCYQSGGGGTTTSESESEQYATKRPRYRDYKRAIRKAQNKGEQFVGENKNENVERDV